ncbi:THUMP-like domain-containing protein [Pararcticibacter amylolyticus]|uniref:Uncharacterized protein n=1 Tax=Pararcticibacter amylolyticus TaxID=2173175 RepID=A0A2U2PAU0_9SPHI|nr:class I SAM-dependent methyltransferase [Pararcticibacter amylolyticus]PWG78516.1 hypothetical protein DDR33_22080 [Pararcticibacter amylolyticus]
MNKAILNKEVQSFIQEHLNDDVTRIALSKSPFPDVSSAELAMQTDGKKRIEKKLPLWYSTQGIYFPPKLNIEQSSSQPAAEYKSKLIKGNLLADLTGGFGVDTFYFAKNASEVYHIEQNSDLSEIAKHNTEVLGARNIHFITGDSISFLKETHLKFDTVYIDPARRVETRKVFLLKDTEPDVTALLPLLLSKASRIIIKTSPLYDIQSGLKELPNVSEVHILSIKNDCKELLWIVDRDFSKEPVIYCSAIKEQEIRTFKFRYSEEREAPSPPFSFPGSFLYEPDVTLLKAGAYKLLGQELGMSKLNINSHLYTSDHYTANFPGKAFKVLRTLNYNDYSKNLKTTGKANVISRNFPLTVDQLRKKHKLSDGGDRFLIFTTGPSGKLIIIEAERVTE